MLKTFIFSCHSWEILKRFISNLGRKKSYILCFFKAFFKILATHSVFQSSFSWKEGFGRDLSWGVFKNTLWSWERGYIKGGCIVVITILPRSELGEAELRPSLTSSGYTIILRWSLHFHWKIFCIFFAFLGSN